MNAAGDILHETSGMLRTARLDHMIVGALAVSVHGDPRATKDVDVAVALPFEERERVAHLLTAKNWPWETWEDPQWGKRLVARHPNGMRVEIFFTPRHELYDREFARKVWIEYQGKKLPFLSPEDLVLRKLVNTRIRRGQDYDDAVSVLLGQGDKLDRDYIREHCGAHRVCGLFDQALQDATRIAAKKG